MRHTPAVLIMVVVALCVLLTGCAEIEITKPDGTHAIYRRMGNQEIGSFLIEPDGSILFEKQKSDNETLYQAINKLVDKVP